MAKTPHTVLIFASLMLFVINNANIEIKNEKTAIVKRAMLPVVIICRSLNKELLLLRLHLLVVYPF